MNFFKIIKQFNLNIIKTSNQFTKMKVFVIVFIAVLFAAVVVGKPGRRDSDDSDDDSDCDDDGYGGNTGLQRDLNIFGNSSFSFINYIQLKTLNRKIVRSWRRSKWSWRRTKWWMG